MLEERTPKAAGPAGAAEVPDPDSPERAWRRRFTAACKLRILQVLTYRFRSPCGPTLPNANRAAGPSLSLQTLEVGDIFPVNHKPSR